MVEFAQRELGYDNDTHRLIKENDIVAKVFDAIHEGMGAKHVHRMNANALAFVGNRLDSISGTKATIIPNLYIWTRDLMTLATCEALYGPENPFKKDPGLVDATWYVTSISRLHYSDGFIGFLKEISPCFCSTFSHLLQQGTRIRLEPRYRKL